MTTPQTVGNQRSLQVTIDSSAVMKAIAGVPRTAYRHLHTFLVDAFSAHRSAWFKNSKLAKIRGVLGFLVSKVNEGPQEPGDKNVAYVVVPAEKTTSSAAGLTALQGQVSTRNPILVLQELGGTVSPGTTMAIAIGKKKGKPLTPQAWRARNPGRELIARRRGGKTILFERDPKTRRLKARFVLTRATHYRPTLKMMATWDGLEQKRGEQLAAAGDKIAKDFENGIDS